MKKVAIVILNWNGRKLLETFLPFVMKHSPGDCAEVVVADNGSSDASVDFVREQFPTVRIIPLDKNHGFAEGYNLALREVNTEYAVLLNNDVEVTAGWLDAPLALMDGNLLVACVQPKIRSWRNRAFFEYAGAAGGYLDRYGYPFCRGRLLHVVEEDRGQYDTPADILWATGACLFVRLEIFRSVGGLDARFFAHQEEVDMCWRMRCRGYRLVYTPHSMVYHVGAATLAAENPRKTFLNFRNSLLMLYKNLPEEELPRVMRLRFWLDYLAALKFLLNTHFKDAGAVYAARREFHRLKASYRTVRLENIGKTVVSPVPEQMPRSLIAAFYLKGRKTYSALYAGDNPLGYAP
ncbi:MAG: glycosyltransferase family 2 protein [Tannerellaceae bacterium]|jgi:GT2 family glycosyltransferase|nr:glycosyltransferase family 2 protein [Tannerellaceae bacterium]